jgi:predicted Fe-Mo cluster-binding NifX family protein
MKIAVSATAPHLDADLDPRFGRCQYFLIVDTESMEFEAIENLAIMAPGGAGIQAAQLIAEKGAEAVITGGCGPNAYQVLSTAGIPVFVGASGSVRDVVEAHRKGELSPIAAASTGPGAGMRGGMGGGGGGMGGGRGGMGGGRGGGMGGGRGGGMGGGRGGGMGGGRGR